MRLSQARQRPREELHRGLAAAASLSVADEERKVPAAVHRNASRARCRRPSRPAQQFPRGAVNLSHHRAHRQMRTKNIRPKPPDAFARVAPQSARPSARPVGQSAAQRSAPLGPACCVARERDSVSASAAVSSYSRRCCASFHARSAASFPDFMRVPRLPRVGVSCPEKTQLSRRGFGCSGA